MEYFGNFVQEFLRPSRHVESGKGPGYEVAKRMQNVTVVAEGMAITSFGFAFVSSGRLGLETDTPAFKLTSYTPRL